MWDACQIASPDTDGCPKKLTAWRLRPSGEVQCHRSPVLGLSQSVGAAREGRVKAAIVIGDSPNFTNGRLGDAIEMHWPGWISW